MLYLFLAIICSSSIALIFKYSETAGLNRYAVTTSNYVTASLVAGVFVWISPHRSVGRLSIKALVNELGGVMAHSGDRLSPESSLMWALIIGGIAGLIFFLSFVYYQISVRQEGVGLSGAFAKLGILLPMALSLVLWREMPRSLQWVGMALAVGSILVINWPTKRTWRGSIRLSLVLLFLFGGLAEFSNKIFQKYALTDMKAHFLLVTFCTACLWSLVTTVRRRKPVTRRDIVTGLAVGVPNLFSSFFLIQALDTIPAAVAFSAFGAGTILLITTVGAIVFKEHLSIREKFAVGLIAVALILISI